MSIKSYNMDLVRIYIDLDGPLADFERMMDFLGEEGKTTKLHKGVYENLPVTHGAASALNELHLWTELGHVQPWILSKIPTENHHSATEKYDWVNAMFGGLFQGRVILTPDKACVGRPQDILIDDHPEWANAHNFPGHVLHFVRYDELKNNWNEVLNDIADIVTKTDPQHLRTSYRKNGKK
jgi:5'(3')-deoxyribonucleotidase